MNVFVPLRTRICIAFNSRQHLRAGRKWILDTPSMLLAMILQPGIPRSEKTLMTSSVVLGETKKLKDRADYVPTNIFLIDQLGSCVIGSDYDLQLFRDD